MSLEQLMTAAFPETKPLLQGVDTNREKWLRQLAQHDDPDLGLELLLKPCAASDTLCIHLYMTMDLIGLVV